MPGYLSMSCFPNFIIGKDPNPILWSNFMNSILCIYGWVGNFPWSWCFWIWSWVFLPLLPVLSDDSPFHPLIWAAQRSCPEPPTIRRKAKTLASAEHFFTDYLNCCQADFFRRRSLSTRPLWDCESPIRSLLYGNFLILYHDTTLPELMIPRRSM